MARKEYESITNTSELEDKLKKATNSDNKFEDHDSPEEGTPPLIYKNKKLESANPAKEAMEAMAKYNLRQATIGVTAHLPTDDDLHLTIIAKKRGLDKKHLVLEYILKGLEKDMNKIGIFEHKK